MPGRSSSGRCCSSNYGGSPPSSSTEIFRNSATSCGLHQRSMGFRSVGFLGHVNWLCQLLHPLLQLWPVGFGPAPGGRFLARGRLYRELVTKTTELINVKVEIKSLLKQILVALGNCLPTAGAAAATTAGGGLPIGREGHGARSSID